METQQSHLTKKEEIQPDFKMVYDGDFADVYFKEGIFLCVAHAPYIPIEAFKATFNEITEAINKYGHITKFIFDKRALRSFHQPSMEWYFTEWKLHLFETFGLTQHRKILPQEK